MTTVMDANEVTSDLNNLIELDYDAIAAYEAAIERLDSAPYKAKLAEFLADHKRHVEELGKAVRSAGGEPATKGDAMKILTKGKVVLADLAGDEAILKAMRANEEVTNTKYEDAVEAGHAEPVHAILVRGLADERRHKGWIATTLDNH